MAVTLAQISEAAFPDRMPDGLGLRVICTPGSGVSSQVLRHVHAHSLSALHVRFMLAVREFAAGSLTLLRGLDPLGRTSFEIVCHAMGPRIELRPAAGGSIWSEELVSLAWQCVEARIDADQGQITLWINHQNQGSSNVGLAESHQLITRSLLIGAASCESEPQCVIDIDEWIVAGQQIGPVRVTPSTPHADDPSRWLVVYNRDLAESVTWARFYQERRAIPFANLLGLAASSAETINFAEYLQLQQTITEYLVSSGLDDQVMGILLGFGVPGCVDVSGSVFPLSSLLHVTSTTPGLAVNPLAGGDLQRPTMSSLQGIKLTARIDAPTMQQACAMIQRALDLEQPGRITESSGAIFLNAYTTRTGLTAGPIDDMLAWRDSLAAASTRLPVNLNSPMTEPPVTSSQLLERDGFAWGWCSDPDQVQFSDTQPGARALLALLQPDSATALSLRDVVSPNLVMRSLAAGYAAAIGCTGPWSLSAFPTVARFFAALERGWTVGEAFLLACPILRERLFLIGDPLLRVSLPRAGFDVLGPVTGLEELTDASPRVLLRDSQHVLNLPQLARPSNQAIGTCVVRRVNSAGSSDLNCDAVRFTVEENQARAMPLLPLWPAHDQWRVSLHNGRVHLLARWDRAIALTGAAEVQLISQNANATTRIERTWPTADRRDLIQTDVPMPEVRTRYAWELHTHSGVTIQTAWSQWVDPMPELAGNIEILEAP